MDHGAALNRGLELAEAVRAGSPDSAALAEQFALAVGESLEPVNRLVAAVLAGGPFAVRRALELVEALHQLAPPMATPDQDETADGAGQG